MLLKLQKYDIELIYKKGKELYVADTLSRAYPKYVAENGSDQLHEDFEIMTVWPLSSPRRLQNSSNKKQLMK